MLARLCKFRTSILARTRGLAIFFKASRLSSVILAAEVGIEVPTVDLPVRADVKSQVE